MRADDLVHWGVTVTVCGAWICMIFRYGMQGTAEKCASFVIKLWELIKYGSNHRQINTRKPAGTDNRLMTWKEVRISIAAIEHELYPFDRSVWTHEIEDCTAKACGYRIDRGIPHYRKPPPPPPSGRSRGGAVSARDRPNPMSSSPDKH